MLLFVRDPTDDDALVDEFLAGLRLGGLRVDIAAIARSAKDLDNAQTVAQQLNEDRVLGGFSYGARISLIACAQVKVAKLLCLAFPFHPKGAPEDPSRLTLFDGAPSTLILQGERDAHGNRAWVRGKVLPAHVRVEWIPDGNHRFEARASSGTSRSENLERMVERASVFVRGDSRR